MSSKSADRRGGPRLSLTMPVTLYLNEGQYDAHTKNMSCRGFLLLVDELLPPDTQFSIEMELPGTDENLLAECEVVWTSENISIHSETHKGMGVKLLGFQYLKKKGE